MDVGIKGKLVHPHIGKRGGARVRGPAHISLEFPRLKSPHREAIGTLVFEKRKRKVRKANLR